MAYPYGPYGSKPPPGFVPSDGPIDRTRTQQYPWAIPGPVYKPYAFSPPVAPIPGLTFRDRVKQTTTDTGTGSLGLDDGTIYGPSGFRTFVASVGYQQYFPYTIVDQTGSNWEVGLGQVVANPDRLVRSGIVLDSPNGGPGSPALVNFGPGTKDIFLTLPAAMPNAAPINVLAFGARGNGVADDSAAIQAAINAALAGQSIEIPDGTFAIGTTIYLKGGVTVVLQAGTVIKWIGTYGGVMFSNDPSVPILRSGVCGVGARIDANNLAGFIFDLHSIQFCRFGGIEVINPLINSIIFRCKADALTTVGGYGFTPRRHCAYNYFYSVLVLGNCDTLFWLEGMDANSICTLNTFEGPMAADQITGTGIRFVAWCDNNIWGGLIRFGLYANNATGCTFNDSANNTITQVIVSSHGRGYLYPPNAVFAGTGSGIVTHTDLGTDTSGIVTPGGGVGNVYIDNRGSQYSVAPTVSFYGGGNLEAVAVISGGTVTAINVTNGGYFSTTAPSVVITSVDGNGSGATATATIGSIGVAAIDVTSGGDGMTSPPAITFSGGTGSGVTAQANMAGNGQVISIAVGVQGTGYKEPPQIVIGGPGTGATAVPIISNGKVVGINVTNGGSGYTSAPTVTIQGGGGANATATAKIGQYVASITVTSNGSGYTAGGAPTVVFGTGNAAATAILGAQVTSVAVNAAGSGYTTPPQVSWSGGGAAAVATAKMGGPAADVGIYGNVFEHLAVDTFGTYTGRIGVQFNFGKTNFIAGFYQTPQAEGGDVVDGGAQSYGYFRTGQDAPASASLDLVIKGGKIKMGPGTINDNPVLQLTTTVACSVTNDVTGIKSVQTISPSTTALDFYGIQNIPVLGLNAGTSNNSGKLYGAYFRGDLAAAYTGTLTNVYDVYCANPSKNAGSGVFTNAYGLFIENITNGGTLSIGARIGSATTATIWCGADADNTTAAAGIMFGLSRDTGIYRGAANQLKTDDSVQFAASTTTIVSYNVPAGTAPTSPTEGDWWNDSTQKCHIAYVDAVKQYDSRTLFQATASVSSTTTAETKSLVGSGTGTMTIPANFFTVGKTLRLRLRGILTTGTPAGTITIQTKMAATVTASTGAVAPTVSLSNKYWEADIDMTCRTTGATGTLFIQGDFKVANAATPSALVSWPIRGNSADPPAAVTVDTTASSLIDFQSITSNANHTITCNMVSLEVMN